MKVSVIIPAFNSSSTISSCIESVLKQGFKDFEIIVVNDGSTDETEKIVKKFSGVRLLSQENRGPAAARNLGASKAKGEIVAFIDADCIASEDWLDEVVKTFEDKEVAGVQGSYKCNQKELIARFIQVEIENRYKKMLKASKLDWIGSYSAAYMREVFLREAGYDEKFRKASGEDPELSFKLSKKGYKLVFNQNAVVYHSHPTALWKYLKSKFQHAFWRVRLYSKHREKIVQDSYTPQVIKLQIAMFYVFSASILGLAFSSFFVWPLAVSLALMFLSSLPFSFEALRKDFSLGIVAPAIVFLRSAAFGFGLIAGILNGVALK